MLTDITIRPSSVAAFVGCPHQWYRTYILGEPGNRNARAAIGTGAHLGIEMLQNMLIRKGSEGEATKQDIIENPESRNGMIDMMTESSIQSFQDEVEKADGSMYFEPDMDENDAERLIGTAMTAYVRDILPYTPIPTAVETRFSYPIKHRIVKEVSGTLDYLGDGTIADVKTSKRAVNPFDHTIQQSIYKFLAEKNGHPIHSNFIHAIVILKTKTTGSIIELKPNVPQIEYLISNLLARLDAVFDGGDPDMLFPGNPKHMMCSKTYCAQYHSCEFKNGNPFASI